MKNIKSCGILSLITAKTYFPKRLFTNFMPEVSELVDLKAKNKITIFLKKILLEKKQSLNTST